MPSKLNEPITDGYSKQPNHTDRGNNNPYGQQHNLSRGSQDYNAYNNRYSGASYGTAQQTGGAMLIPGPYGDPNYEDGGMQNLRTPPDDSHVYPQAPPTGPNAAENLGRHPQTVECPWCHAVVTTKTKRRLGFKSGGAAVLVAAIAWPLFWVPLLIPGLHRKTHYCPQCNRKIGRGHRRRS
ncbi:hypothetical protein COEREDRAFT_82060 [Coemansia reversa NRRL 1564]|uniref:LITAF domain-containing protein n=1 Tax=Coemansia reversa (strain ATCC 12441 / NRRL 1564) TaxID=763665 RepID=A0A2G5B8I8_COERN|nr:hypothetical protein COEREDRAFT_82060 [Coemansia reversa NRRL 1564]|eukprot:PIA15300.1 hypothetical protein COEREDRAFT_82060 [Coemansia reversa NRRL 1564]